MDHTRVEEAVDLLRRSSTSRPSGGPRPPAPPGPSRQARPSSPAKPIRPSKPTIPLAPDRPASVPAKTPAAVIPAGTGFRLVVVVDDGLYAGHRMALRNVSQLLALRVPVLVLTTNERLWHSNGPV